MSYAQLVIDASTAGAGNDTWRWQDQARKQSQRDFNVQIVVSVVFGASAFLAFCVCESNSDHLRY